MTWEVKDLRKNEDPVPEELIEEKGGGLKPVGDQTPFNELLEATWGDQFTEDSPLARQIPPQSLRRMYNEVGLITDAQWAAKRKLYTRGTIPDSGFDDPKYYT